jgi:hypothetical protein
MQHIKQNAVCQATQKSFSLLEQGQSPTRTRKMDAIAKLEEQLVGKIRRVVESKQATLGNESAVGLLDNVNMGVHSAKDDVDDLSVEEDAYLFDPYVLSSASDGSTSSGEEQWSVQEGQAHVGAIDANAGKEAGKEFKAYARHSYQNRLDFTATEANAIKIMHKLIRKKATLDTYDDVMEWHLLASKKLQPQDSLGKSPHFISRKKLMNKLRTRYNMDKKYAVPHSILLPHTQSRVDIWKKCARDNVVSLLTDPRWKDEDWLYFDDDPFGKPPKNCPFVEDLNTGEAYLETYKKLITKPNQILVAIPLYIDGAVTGQYDKLQVTALKMTIGILNRRARDREFAWRTLGYVPNYTKEDSRGRKILVESGHVAAHELYVDGLTDEEDEGHNADAESEVDKAADYHAILSVLLESVYALVEEGMVIDIYHKDKLYKDCELVFFVPYVKCDGDEGDKLCCSYRSRGKDVKQLCRYCQCPNEETDNPDAVYPFKTEPMLRKLFEKDDAERLKELSQIGIKNAFHGLRFGLHNNRGIHGACPWELLHAILLGIFKYARDCLFAQMGASSATAAEINALAVIIGAQFARQSDRNKPRTKFAKGILKGKLMGKEFTGVLLVMAAILRCEAGQKLLKSARKKNFRYPWQIKDWILLVDTLLQWEAYLVLPKMQKSHVQRLKKKHKFLMFLLKKVGNRVKGMGFKVMKFHAIIHLAYDILMFGVPMNVDTGSNESHHKTTKVAAKLTQKDIKTFEKQTSNRCDDFHVLDLAMEEINGRPLWEYYNGFEHKTFVQRDPVQSTGGMKMKVYWNTETEKADFKILTRMKDQSKVAMEDGFLRFALDIQEDLAHLFPVLPICAEHSREGQIFRAHPNFMGKGAWRDWVMINWEGGALPGKIWGFIDLTSMPNGTSVVLRNGAEVQQGAFAIIESADYVELEEEPGRDVITSDLFTEILLDTNTINEEGVVTVRKYYLVDVETFKDPIVVIPNIGAQPKCKYLLMTPRSQWSEQFIWWLKNPHEEDRQEMAPTEDDPEQDSEEVDEIQEQGADANDNW